MNPYSTDVRTRVVQASEHHEGAMRQLATTFRVRLSCVRRRLQHYRETGSVAPKPHGGGAPAKVDGRGLEVVQPLVHAAADATLSELCQRCEEPHQLSLSVATMSRVLAQLRLTRTKTVSRHGTRARRGAAAAGRLPRGDPSA
jgi:transposase